MKKLLKEPVERNLEKKVSDIILVTVYFPNREVQDFQTEKTQKMFEDSVKDALKNLNLEVRLTFVTSALHDKILLQYDHIKL